MSNVLVIGGGVNGLVSAALLARRGHRVTLLERQDRTGGGARTGEIAPGVRAPTFAHAAALDPALIRALDLERHGLRILSREVDVCAIGAGDRALLLWNDPGRAAAAIGARSAKDAARYPAFLESFRRVARVIQTIAGAAPPSIDQPTGTDLLELIKAGRAFRGLGTADAYRLLRWMPMAIADFAGEWFESEPLRAAVAGGGILGSFLGPWSAGSTAVLLWRGAQGGHPFATGWPAAGGTGSVAEALTAAARQAGVDIQTNVAVSGVLVDGGKATGVRLANGDTVEAHAVVSNLDPRRTLLGLVDPAHLDPEFVRRLQNLRARGTLAKINFALSSLPAFTALAPLDAASRAAALSGRVRLGPDIDSIERAFDAAKYGRFSDEPWIELTVPTIADPALAPAGQHVVSAYVQYAPCQLRDTTWDEARDRLAAAATATIERAAPGFTASIAARETFSPADLEGVLGLTGGHIFHGELALDQWFVTRPVLGWAGYKTPIGNLYLCGSGTHPGTGLDGRSGALAAKAIAAALG